MFATGSDQISHCTIGGQFKCVYTWLHYRFLHFRNYRGWPGFVNFVSTFCSFRCFILGTIAKLLQPNHVVILYIHHQHTSATFHSTCPTSVNAEVKAMYIFSGHHTRGDCLGLTVPQYCKRLQK